MMRQNSLLVQAASCLKISDDGHSSTSPVTPASEVAQIGAILPSRTTVLGAGRRPISRLHYDLGSLQGVGPVAGSVPKGSE